MAHGIPHFIVQVIRLCHLKLTGLEAVGLIQAFHRSIEPALRLRIHLGLLLHFLEGTSHIHQLSRDFPDKAGCFVILGLAPDHPLFRTGHGQFLHRPGDPHITEPALFLQITGIIAGDRQVTWENPIFHSGKKYMGKFQTLGAVQRHQQHIITVLIHRINIGDKRYILKKSSQCRILRLVLVSDDL